jgi:hypothetical protein
MEEWRETEHEGYEVSNMSRVRSYWRMGSKSYLAEEPQRIIKWVMCGNPGHKRPRVRLYHNLMDNPFHLALKAFVGPRLEGMECCHNNGDPMDGSVENLRWDTHYNNMQDRHRHGTDNRGTRNPMSKLKEWHVRGIRWMMRRGFGSRETAKHFRTSQGTVNNIHYGRSWGWLT